jgi:hypothetical protein
MFANKIVLQKKAQHAGVNASSRFFFSKPITTSGENGKK